VATGHEMPYLLLTFEFACTCTDEAYAYNSYDGRNSCCTLAKNVSVQHQRSTD
jgi:hypothetical protein